jgi:glycerophosphoryl diester phosphodiesterase
MHRNRIRIHWFFTLALLLTVGLVGCRSASNNDKVVEKIESKNKALKVVEALHDPNSRYVVVVSHRGDWRNYPENSIPAIESVIKMGVDMMELDLKRTKDSVLVLCHDWTIDRTTTGRGHVSDYTYEELLQFDLKRGHGIAIPGLKIPTLRQALEVCKDRITVNVDQGYEYYDQVLEIAEELGVTDQLLIKGGHLWPEVQAKLAEHPHNLMYMPVVTLNGSEWSHTLFESYIIGEEPQMAFEICFDELNDEVRETVDRVLASGSKVWVNTIWASLCGGYDDDRAYDSDPASVYNPILELGTSIIQTDRPEFLIRYLESIGRR